MLKIMHFIHVVLFEHLTAHCRPINPKFVHRSSDFYSHNAFLWFFENFTFESFGVYLSMTAAQCHINFNGASLIPQVFSLNCFFFFLLFSCTLQPVATQCSTASSNVFFFCSLGYFSCSCRRLWDRQTHNVRLVHAFWADLIVIYSVRNFHRRFVDFIASILIVRRSSIELCAFAKPVRSNDLFAIRIELFFSVVRLLIDQPFLVISFVFHQSESANLSWNWQSCPNKEK